MRKPSSLGIMRPMHTSARLIQELTATVRELLPQWGIATSAEVSLITTSENATFNVFCATSQRRIVIRVHRHGYHTRREIESEHAWIRALREQNLIETPALVPMHSGAVLAEVTVSDGMRHVAAFEYMPGVEPAAESEDLPTWFRTLGVLSARLHQHSREWRRPADFTRKVWDFETTLGARPHWGDWRRSLGLDAMGSDAFALLERTARVLEQKLAAYGKSAARFGLIHADLRLANLLVDKAQLRKRHADAPLTEPHLGAPHLGIIDFDDCGFGWFMYDFAAAISFHEHLPIAPELMAAWIEGYGSEVPLAVADTEMIPVMVMLRRMLLTAWVASRSETATAQAVGGAQYTRGTVELAECFLAQHS